MVNEQLQRAKEIFKRKEKLEFFKKSAERGEVVELADCVSDETIAAIDKLIMSDVESQIAALDAEFAAL